MVCNQTIEPIEPIMSSEADWPIVRIPRHTGPDGFLCSEQLGEVSIPGRQAVCVSCHATLTLWGQCRSATLRPAAKIPAP